MNRFLSKFQLPQFLTFSAFTSAVTGENTFNLFFLLAVGPIVIRTEEVLIVVFVLVLWAGAIALFFNRWGKIRMLEPYQPKFHEEEHRPSCPLVELSNTGVGGVGQVCDTFILFDCNFVTYNGK